MHRSRLPAKIDVAAIELRAVAGQLGPPRDPVLAEWFAALADTSAGIAVNESTALNFSAVYRAVQLISGAVSTLPLHIYQKSDAGRRQVADHPLDELLNEEP